MKKLFLLSTMLCCLATAGSQVISGYGFGSFVGTYEEIEDGIVVSNGIEPNDMNNRAFYSESSVTELTTMAGIPIGFDFEYNDVFCNQFVIGSNGYITVGRDQVTVNPESGAFMFSREGEGRTNCFGVMPNADIYGSDSTTISYKLTGETPNRVLVIQYKNWGVGLDYWGENIKAVDMQIKLYETDSKIEFVFRNWNNFDGYSKGARIGLRGNDDDIHCRFNSDDDWQNTIQRTGDAIIYFGDNSNITDGLTFSFMPPAACDVPSGQPASIQYEATTTQISGSFVPTETADHYLTLLSTDEALTELPQNGTYYSKGDVLGNATVLSYDTTAVFATDASLQGTTTYHVFVMAANSFCKQGPVYNTDAPLTAAIRTMPGAPAGLSVTEKHVDKLLISVTANEVGDDVLVAICDSLYEPIINYGEEPYIGTPEGSYEVGDFITENGGKVVYIGGSAENIEIDGLEQGTGYYLRAFSVNSNMEYSTEVIDARGATIATLPYTPNLSKAEIYGLPVDWTEEGGTFRVSTQYNQVGGEDEYQLECNLAYGDAINGKFNTVTTSPILIDKRDVVVSFYYNMSVWSRMTGSTPYNEWAETDTFALQVSKDGINFDTLKEYTAQNNLQLDSLQAFALVEGDLSSYINDTVQIRIYWKNYNAAGARLIIERFSVDGREIPAIPAVTIGEVTYNSALVTWRGEQENYEMASCKEGDEWTYKTVNGFEAELVDLEAETTYQVKVRGIVAEGDTTEWSETATFTTEPLPECPIPSDLTSEIVENEYIKVSWTGNEEHLAWDVRYRPGSATTWEVIEGLAEETYTFTDLEPEIAYLWTVRASCTMDRISSWAAQERFTSGRTAVSLANASSLKVSAFEGYVNIFNSGVYVKEIALYDLQGRSITKMEINSSDNIIIPLRGIKGFVFVKVNTIDHEFVYKVPVR